MTPVVSSREKAHAALTVMPLRMHDREQAACADH
jgi:hypothetical protein